MHIYTSEPDENIYCTGTLNVGMTSIPYQSYFCLRGHNKDAYDFIDNRGDITSEEVIGIFRERYEVDASVDDYIIEDVLRRILCIGYEANCSDHGRVVNATQNLAGLSTEYAHIHGVAIRLLEEMS